MDLLDFHFSSATAFSYALVKWLLMASLLTSSRIWNHARFAVPLVLGVVLTCLGMLFKVEHWVFGDEMLLLGAVVFSSSYFLWFRAKDNLTLLDYLKLLWVLGAAGTVVVTAVYRSLIRPIAGVTEALFWAMALLMVYQRWIRRPNAVE